MVTGVIRTWNQKDTRRYRDWITLPTLASIQSTGRLRLATPPYCTTFLLNEGSTIIVIRQIGTSSMFIHRELAPTLRGPKTYPLITPRAKSFTTVAGATPTKLFDRSRVINSFLNQYFKHKISTLEHHFRQQYLLNPCSDVCSTRCIFHLLHFGVCRFGLRDQISISCPPTPPCLPSHRPSLRAQSPPPIATLSPFVRHGSRWIWPDRGRRPTRSYFGTTFGDQKAQKCQQESFETRQERCFCALAQSLNNIQRSHPCARAMVLSARLSTRQRIYRAPQQAPLGPSPARGQEHRRQYRS